MWTEMLKIIKARGWWPLGLGLFVCISGDLILTLYILGFTFYMPSQSSWLFNQLALFQTSAHQDVAH